MARWSSITPKKWVVRRRLPELSRRDRWVVALLFCLSIGAVAVCPSTIRYLMSRQVVHTESITGTVAIKGVMEPPHKKMVPVRWYVMIDTDKGERKRVLVDHATYVKLSPGTRIHQDKDGTVTVLSK